MVNAISVKIDTYVTSSDVTIAMLQPIFPKGIGYLFQNRTISIGITEIIESNIQFLIYEIISKSEAFFVCLIKNDHIYEMK